MRRAPGTEDIVAAPTQRQAECGPDVSAACDQDPGQSTVP